MAGAMDQRSATNHAGIPAIRHATFTTAGTATQVVLPPGDGRSIKLHSYMITPTGNGLVELTSSGLGLDGTTLTGAMHTDDDVKAPITQNGGRSVGIGTCIRDQALVVSGTAGAAGNLTYSLVP